MSPEAVEALLLTGWLPAALLHDVAELREDAELPPGTGVVVVLGEVRLQEAGGVEIDWTVAASVELTENDPFGLRLLPRYAVLELPAVGTRGRLGRLVPVHAGLAWRWEPLS